MPTTNFATLFSSKNITRGNSNSISLVNHTGNQVFIYHVCYIFFSFFEYHELFKALQLTQFYHKDSKSFKNNIMFICSFRPLCCCYCDVFLTLGFILRFFIEKPPSHIHIGVFIFILAYSESTETSKMELFAKVVTCWQPSVTNFSKGYVVDVWLASSLCIGKKVS